MRISYVILHYQNKEITNECVKFLDETKGGDSRIIIVDNGSPNYSGKEIKEEYKSREDIIVILNNINLGFAEGNNIGFVFAKEKLKSDIIIVMNNDILIKDSNFESKLVRAVSLNDTEIIAPDIVSKDSIHQNPHRTVKLSNYKIVRRLIIYNIVLAFIKFKWIRAYLVGFINNYSTGRKVTRKFISHNMEDIIPHGACIIYTQTYIDNENIAFVPKTFLFSEEDILYDYIKMKKYKVMYIPELSVQHLEDASINYDRSSKLDRLLFNMRNRRKSLFIILLNRCFPYNK